MVKRLALFSFLAIEWGALTTVIVLLFMFSSCVAEEQIDDEPDVKKDFRHRAIDRDQFISLANPSDIVAFQNQVPMHPKTIVDDLAGESKSNLREVYHCEELGLSANADAFFARHAC